MSFSFSAAKKTASLDPTDPNAASEACAELRAECDSAETDARKSVLLHELGVLEDDAHNDGQAARDLLSAVNALPGFLEPLERLVVLIERRKSYKNLGKLVDRLAKVAETPEELARALVGVAEYRSDHEGDDDGARQALERATQTKGDDVDAWLSLEHLAGKVGDAALRRRALSARADLAQDPTWKALLSIDAAKLHADAGDLDAAVAALDAAIALKGPATFAALEELERLAISQHRGDIAARALEARANLVARALDGEASRTGEGSRATGEPDTEAQGVPEARRSLAHLGDGLLRAARYYAQRGDAERAVALLDQVVERLPDDPVATGARMRAAEAAGDTTTAAALARGELQRGVKGSPAAALWMRITEAAASSGDARGALDAIAKALAEDPACLPARTLELDLLSGTGDRALLAQALEATATHLGSEPLAAQLFLLAADTWARGGGDVNAAKAALSQAAAAGASLDVVARVGRLLAAVTNDGVWFDEATRRLLATNPPDAERVGLWFETARSRLLRGDYAGAGDALASLAVVPGGAWLGSALRAYVVGSREGILADRGASALEVLAETTPASSDGEAPGDASAMARAFRVASAIRFFNGGQTDAAVAELSELHASDPGDAVTATALATLLTNAGKALSAADVLVACAASIDERPVSAALHLEAGILRWVSGDRARALDAFEEGAQRAPEAGSALLAWALRAAQPNDVDARRRALAATETSEDAVVRGLELFALEAGAGGDAGRAREALAALDTTLPDGPLAVAVELAQALYPGSSRADAAARLEALAAHGADATMLSRAAASVAALSDTDASARERAASRWAETDRTFPPALEWLGQAIAAGNLEREIAAREAVAVRIGAPLAAAAESSARLVARLARDDTRVPLLTSKDPIALLTNLELSPPASDPRRRAAALLEGAEAIDAASRSAAVDLAAWNLLAAGETQAAIRAFRRAAAAQPGDIVAWEGLRAASELAGEKALVAEASAALGDLVSDDEQGAELWERAATLLLDELSDPVRGEAALSRAVERDVSRTAAFDRLFRIVRARRDGPRLLGLISERLDVAEDPEEIAKLYWERARALREAGDAPGALEALENVTMLEPDHVGALALTGEIYITEKRFAEAAESLSRLARLSEAPAQQRLMSGVAAVDLYEHRLNDVPKALEVLVALHRSGLATLPVRERLARAAAKTESWETATGILEELMTQRDTSQGRVEAARLAMVVYRDRLGTPERAERAVGQLLAESPDDGEALDLALSGVLSKSRTRRFLEAGRTATTLALANSPLNLEQMTRLSEIARQLDDVQLRQATLGAIVALGGQTAAILSELSALDGRIARNPQIAVDDGVVQSLRDPGDRGPIPELLKALATTLSEALGPGLAAFGVTKKDRVRPQDGLPVRNEVATWIGALGIGEFELYVGGRDPNGLFAIASEVPAIVVGGSVASPLSSAHRATLARELLGLKLGTTILRHRDTSDVAALVTAACRVGGFRLESPPYAMLAEFERLLSKELPRKVRRVLPDLAGDVAHAGHDPVAWVQAAQGSLDRVAAVAIGDVSWVLADGATARKTEPPVTTEAKLRAARLLSFVLSADFFAIRDRLGMGVR